MMAADKLLRLEGRRLEVWGVMGTICVKYRDADVMKGAGTYVGEFGRGKTFEDAFQDYADRISGKTLVFNSMTDRAEKVIVL